MRWKKVGPAQRRAFLTRTVCVGVTGFFSAPVGNAPIKMKRRSTVGGIGGAVVPPFIVDLADYGGVPEAGSACLVNAFSNAFARLASTGGGILIVPPGIYDFGSYADAHTIILCRNFRNIVISAYGATFLLNTVAKVVPNLFYFFNFDNITIAGASFMDLGFSPLFNWRGMYCVGIQADRSSSGFRMVDCYAKRVVGLFVSHNNAAGRRHMSNISIQGEVHYSYYGVGANFLRGGIHIDLFCHNVRRAFIAYALCNAEINIRADSTSDWPGSNGLVALVSTGSSNGNVYRVSVRVDVSGECIHSGYVHFYHQGTEPAGVMRDIDATVNVRSRDVTANLFVFDHEIDSVLPRTTRVWDRIWLHGSITGKLRGRVVSNGSVTTSPGVVYVDRNLVKLAEHDKLGTRFHIRPSS